MSKRRTIAATLAAAICAAGLATWTIGSASGAGAPNRITTTCGKDGFDGRYFRKQVDSIVSYGQPVSAHMHDFFGRLDVSSTMNSNWPITPGHEDDPGYTPSYTNCSTYGDWAAYWFPTALFNGTVVQPSVLKDTWQSPAGSTVATPPFGETFVAGDSHATGPNPDPHVAFTCGNIDVTYTRPTDCTSVPGGVVTAQVTFPDCWDGKVGYTYPPGTRNYDTPTGLAPTHFSYSVNGACTPGQIPCVPGTMIAQLVTQQTFIDPRTNAPMVNPNNADGSLALSFASGPYYTYHADYIDTWNHVLSTIVGACLNHDPYWIGRASCPSVVNNITIQ